ncbi:LOW QUALITY PROTEIN: DNA repair protein complementing XP-C cells-like [Haliotis rubra]|uniref:LOW QUALITY PROTEIN: DNA repair protein complementing XP-C cells-like n=1 Tax=Haliotis rubra TaxID=36100 RepID=UPI001EE5E73B|nr:LOW QUALITY PROTEIN: DNA repair protein complementing XP-C cells-like [Haliotis rubra]
MPPKRKTRGTGKSQTDKETKEKSDNYDVEKTESSQKSSVRRIKNETKEKNEKKTRPVRKRRSEENIDKNVVPCKQKRKEVKLENSVCEQKSWNGKKSKSGKLVQEDSQENMTATEAKRMSKKQIDSIDSFNNKKASKKVLKQKGELMQDGKNKPEQEDISDEGKIVHESLKKSDSEDDDSEDDDFEEVEDKTVKEVKVEMVAMETKPDISQPVGVMSDSDCSDFENVESVVKSKKDKAKTVKKKPAVKTVKSKPAVKTLKTTPSAKRRSKSTSDVKSKSGTRKRQHGKAAAEVKSKFSKMDGVKPEADVPSASQVEDLDVGDVTAVLLRMEGASCSQSVPSGQGEGGEKVKGSRSTTDSEDDDEEEEDSEDWEEVEDHKGSPFKSQIPQEPVEITLEAPDIMRKKRKKKKFDWLGYIQQTMRRFQKDVRMNIHKVHLLCLLSHGFHQSNICNADTLVAQAVSVIPSRFSRGPTSCSLEGLRQIVKWFREEFPLQAKSQYFDGDENNPGLIKEAQLEAAISTRQICDGRVLATIFIIFLRTMGFDVRLMMSLQPMGFKVMEEDKFKVKKNPKLRTTPPLQEQLRIKKKTEKKEKPVLEILKDQKTQKVFLLDKKLNLNPKLWRTKILKPKPRIKKLITSLRRARPARGNNSRRRNFLQRTLILMGKRNPRRLRKRDEKKTMKEEIDGNESGFEESVPSDCDSSFSEEEYTVKKQKGKRGGKGKQKAVKKEKVEEEVVVQSSGSEFMEEETSFRSPLREKLNKRKNRKVLSSDSDGEGRSGNKGCDIWTEVFLPKESRWLCVDCVHNIIDKPYEIESKLVQPVHYVIAFSAGGYLRDVTARYASQWMSHTRKLRVDQEWWDETLEIYKNPAPEHGDNDEDDIRAQLMKRPLPTSVGQFKNHPLYALSRHLLKYEAIFPESSIPLGYIRGEPIYARECVHTLHSRENWLREGRAVRLGESTYKNVKSRKRWKQKLLNPDPDALDLELFGLWQTEIYIPPPAVDGKIQRNEYGNVELFKPWMLPGGTVHLQGFPALNRVAKKLYLDVAPAMVGWDTHCGFSHPLIDGWIVCEEHKDILIAAWDEDQEIQKQREIEKREKRVLGNWKLLTRSLLIRERLKKRFDLQDTNAEEEMEEKEDCGEEKTGKEEKAVDVVQSWPANRQKGKHKKLSENTETM